MQTYAVIANRNYYHREIKQLYQIEQFFPNYTCSNIYKSKGPKDSIKNASKASLENDFLVVLGGDVTLNEVIRGIQRWNKNISILYIPAGTCNDMGKNVLYRGPLKRYIKEAMDNIQEHDIFQFNNELFCYVAAGGFLMNVPYSVSIADKTSHKNNAYIERMIKEFFKTPPKVHMNIKIDNKQIEGEYIAAILSNTHSLGGFPIYENSKLDDQKCELMLVKDYSKIKTLLELTKVLKKEGRLDQLSFAEYYQGHNIRIQMEPSFPHHFCLDGEQSLTNTHEPIEVKPLSRVRLMKGSTIK